MTLFSFKIQVIFLNYIAGEMCNNSDATLIVAKKDFTRMRQLNDLLIAVRNANPEFIEFPVLIIDDECDEAGVDIGQNYDTSANHFEIRRLISNPNDGTIMREITRPPALPVGNKLLRRILESTGFLKTMYVGFTATPYATVFQEMNESEEENQLRGLDLYPRDYLLVLDDPLELLWGEVFIGRYQIDDAQENQNYNCQKLKA